MGPETRESVPLVATAFLSLAVSRLPRTPTPSKTAGIGLMGVASAGIGCMATLASCDKAPTPSKRPPKLRILLEVRSWNSGLNGDHVAEILQHGQVATREGVRLVVVKANLMVRRAYTTLRKALRTAGGGQGVLPTIVPFAPELDVPTLGANDAAKAAALAAGEYGKLVKTSREGFDR